MATAHDITVIGASAGGLTALRTLLRALPADYPAAILVVLHIAPRIDSRLNELLGRAGPLPASWGRDGAPIEPGRISIAPPDQHLLVCGDRLTVTHGPRENRHRPSIDVLFRSAAVAFGRRVTGVVLSGMLDDGAAGLWAIERRGGVALVQDPEEAEYPDMPRNALEAVPAAESLPLAGLSARLIELTREPMSDDAGAIPRDLAHEVRMATDHDTQMEELDALGKRVPFTCPECGGALWELDGGVPRFRCHVGHAYSLHTLAADQTSRVEAALWAALRSLEESERIATRLAGVTGGAGPVNYHAEIARSSAEHAKVLRGMLAEAPLGAEEPGADRPATASTSR